MTKVTEKQSCRACGTKFSRKVLLDFGEQTIVDFLEEREEGRGKAPLQLVYCQNCGLVQLRHTVDADTLYKKFWYRSSLNEQMRSALRDVVFCAERYAEVRQGEAVCDIGCNDGELLLNYSREAIFKVGFEPAEELAKEAMKSFQVRNDEMWQIIPGYFNAIEALAATSGKLYKHVIACAMFYDLDDPVSFLVDVQSILAPDGLFIIQMNYLGTMIRNLTFDNIGHEHLCYYSLGVLERMLEKVGLGVVDVELNEVNGGSIRVYIMHSDIAKLRRNTEAISDLLMRESVTLSEDSIIRFAERAEVIARLLKNFLVDLKVVGKKVYAYGASTRGMTLLQMIFKDAEATNYIIAAAERDEKKYGKRMAGLDIPIVPEQEAREKADYMLVLPYHFWKSIRHRERTWLITGGKFIIPLPYPKVMGVSADGPLMTVSVARDLESELESLRV